MPQSSNIKYPIPNRGDKGSYDKFVSLINRIDEEDWAARTDRNLAVIGGGTVNLSNNGEVTWTEDFVFIDQMTGKQGVLSSDQSPITLSDGDVGWVNVVRGPIQNYSLDISVDSTVPNTSKSQALFARYGDELWVKNRRTISSGNVSVEGDVSTVFIPLSLNDELGEGPNTVSRYRLNLADTNVPQDSLTFRFKSEAQTTLSGLEGSIDLYDVTDPGNEILKASFSVTSNQPQEYSSIINPESSTNKRIYEVRAGLDSAQGPYNDPEKFILWHSTFEVFPT